MEFSPWSEARQSSRNGKHGPSSVSLNPGLEAPIAKGAAIGKIIATANGKPLAEAPVIALADVARAGFFERLRQRVAGWFSK